MDDREDDHYQRNYEVWDMTYFIKKQGPFYQRQIKCILHLAA
jgi:hypothetical protein